MADEVVLRFRADIDAVEAQINAMKKKLKELEDAADDSNDPLIKQKGILEQLEDEYKALSDARRKATDPQAVKNYTSLMESNRKEVNKLTQSQKTLAQETNKTTQATKGLTSSLANIAERLPFGGMISQLRSVGQDMQGLGNSANKSGSMIGNAFKFALGPIGLIIVAIGSLIAYFRRTDEGAVKLEGIMKGLGFILDMLLKPLELLGKALYETFTSPVTALTTLVKYTQKVVDLLTLPFIALGKAIKLALSGNIDEAQKVLADAANKYKEIAVSVYDTVKGIGEGFDNAVESGMELAKLFDELADAQRAFSVELVKNETEIDRLLIAAKNRTIAAQERIKLLQKASELEVQNSNKQIEFANQNLQLILREELAREQIFNTQNMSIEAMKELLNQQQTTDEQLQRVADAEINLLNLKRNSLLLQEKIQNRLDQAREQWYNESIKAEQDINKVRITEFENMLKKQAISLDFFNQVQIEEQIKTLEKQKQINKRFGKDTIDLDKAIVENQIKLQEIRIAEETKLKEQAKAEDEKLKADLIKGIDQENQKRINALKNATDAQLNNTKLSAEEEKQIKEQLNVDILKSDIDKINQELAMVKLSADERLKLELDLDEKKRQLNEIARKREEEKEKQHQDNLKQIKQKGIEITQELINAAVDIQTKKKQQELQTEIDSLATETDAQIQSLDKQRQARIISDELYEAKKKALESQRIEREKAIKKKQFEADKKAQLIKVAIDTAAGIVKTFANLGYPLGILPAALLAAQGAAQAAIIQAQPAPKFEKGGEVGGRLHVHGGTLIEAEKGEYVVNRQATSKHKDLIESINDGNFDNYLNKQYIIPAILDAENRKRKAKQSSTERLIKSYEQNSIDLSYLERLTKNNKTVQVANHKDIAEAIAKKVKFNNNYIK